MGARKRITPEKALAHKWITEDNSLDLSSKKTNDSKTIPINLVNTLVKGKIFGSNKNLIAGNKVTIHKVNKSLISTLQEKANISSNLKQSTIVIGRNDGGKNFLMNEKLKTEAKNCWEPEKNSMLAQVVSKKFLFQKTIKNKPITIL